jgi:DNA-binding response OmpR family regulator
MKALWHGSRRKLDYGRSSPWASFFVGQALSIMGAGSGISVPLLGDEKIYGCGMGFLRSIPYKGRHPERLYNKAAFIVAYRLSGEDMQGKKILIIDDDAQLRKMMEHPLVREGAEVIQAENGREGLRLFHANQPDLVLLDVMMPEMHGWDTCKNIRKVSDVPIIMVTALGNDEDVVYGFGIGADDYITKPFNVYVFVARVQAALRRTEKGADAKQGTVYADAYLTIDLDQLRVETDGQAVNLTATEFRLLGYLIENAGRVMSFEQILESVWGWEYRDDVNYIRVYISSLRKKLEKDPKNPEYIQNVQGIGYHFVKQS